MNKLKSHKLYIDNRMKVWYFTDKKGKLEGSYTNKVAAEEGLRIYIEGENEPTPVPDSSI